MDRQITDLYTLQTALKKGIESIFTSKVWLRAEISSVKIRPAGHCYMELSQSSGSNLIAEAQAIIWASKFRMLDTYFRSVTGTSLQSGMTVLVQVQVNYSQLYGLSLIVDDIDPEYTLGEKERIRRETIEKLTREGLIDKQKSLSHSPLPRRLAVISAGDAAGFGDFTKHLGENPYGFRFQVSLFPALMQGAQCPDSILSALEDISLDGREFDLALILRGGGSDLDLSCYDDYRLCAGIACFPLPVYTAIGHERDYHIADMVAHDYAKTPTALADMIVDWFADEDARLLGFATRLKLAFSAKISSMETRVGTLQTRIRSSLRTKVTAKEGRLAVLEAKIHGADPRNIIRRGYILALDARGVALRSVAGSAPGDKVSLMFSDGRMDCTVDRVTPGTSPGSSPGSSQSGLPGGSPGSSQGGFPGGSQGTSPGGPEKPQSSPTDTQQDKR